ncbi:unnamed protein product [Cylicocyclus nassatus]|uniref:Major facilitator superfamily (MFS) profile domain-containing protein n=1 Tax=Cylicocyclus nassatus TaxID=53992 RepID=A0AA36HBK8_CYLNA|nr:unnamed protein product [Cylicocyclus nassatus]
MKAFKFCAFLRNSFRYLLILIAFFCLLSVNSNHTIINFTFICMSRDYNFTGNGYSPAVDYSPSEKTAIIWAVPIGTLLGTFPVNYFYTRFGAKWPFLVAGILSAAATASIPVAAMFDLKVLLALRFVQGLAFSGNFGAVGLMCVRWAALNEISIFVSILTSFTPVSAVITNPVSAWMCTDYGWPLAFYTHAGFGLIMFLLWILLYTDDPQTHRIITKTELDRIQKGKTKEHIERDSFVPYKEVILDKVILIVWLNAFVYMTALTFVLTYAPLYFRLVLKYDVSVAGTLSSVASSIHLPIKLAGGIISDRLSIISERYKMWFFNTISVGIAGICTLLVGIFPQRWPGAGFAMFALDNTVMALNAGAFYKCGTLYARQYSHVVLTVIQFMKCVGMFVAAGLFWIFVHDESSYNQWRYTYWLQGACLIVVNVLFYIIATDQPAAFTSITRATRQAQRKKAESFCSVTRM